jgi:DNA modification methylase
VTVRILRGDVRDRLREIPKGSVHMVVTSPPYYALRDYGVDGQLGLERTPEEYIRNMVRIFRAIRRVLRDDGTVWLNMGDSYVSDGGAGWQGRQGERANRTHTQRGLLKNSSMSSGLKPKDLFGIPWMLAFALRADGWYLRQDIIWRKRNPMPESVRDRCTKAHEYVFLLSKSERYFFDAEAISEPSVYADEAIYDNGANGLSSSQSHRGSTRKFKAPGGFPAGWDTRTGGRSHRELTGRYSEATQLPRSGNKQRTYGADRGVPVGRFGENGRHQGASVPWEGLTRNKRSVWDLTSKPFPDAHFATFPPELPETCIKAGTSAMGVCPTCQAPYERLERTTFVPQPDVSEEKGVRGAEDQKQQERRDNGYPRGVTARTTIGWAPACECHGKWITERAPRPTPARPNAKVTVRRYEPAPDAPGPCPALVLDPFGGSGTTGLVAVALRRDCILIELNEAYADMAERRIHGPLFAETAA